jgi:2-polyprenyl-3-methyl-5-hydroxy-6-metoxy-1,4-benzoquinol methylase
MATGRSTVDPAALQNKQDQLSGYLTGAFVAAMVGLGMRLGLYRAMDGAGPLTSAGLATKTGLHERWVREWLYAQGAAGVLDVGDGESFELSPEGAALLAHEDALTYMSHFPHLPHIFEVSERIEESFQTGIGLTADDRGANAALQNERGAFGNWHRNALVATAIPALDGMVDRLRTGATVADVGCGAGVAVLELAKAFPRSTIHGYDVSHEMLSLAEAKRRREETGNAAFHLVDDDPLPSDASIDLIMTLDCLHDMTHPEQVVSAIRAAIRPDGVWFIGDIDGRADFAENVAAVPTAAMGYAISVLNCLPSSLSEPDGVGLGSFGLAEPQMRELVSAAGFTRFRRLNLPHPINAYYEVQP